MRNVTAKVAKKIKTCFMFNNLFPENEMIWKNMVKVARSQMAV
jgi:hypothetical protein